MPACPTSNTDDHIRSGDEASSEADLERKHFENVVNSFLAYRGSSIHQVESKEKYFSLIPTRHQSMLEHQLKRFQEMRSAIKSNCQFLESVVHFTANMFENSDLTTRHPTAATAGDDASVATTEGRAKGEEIDRVRTTIRQCVRDWAVEGRDERKQSYGPIVDFLKRTYPAARSSVNRANISVLVPGAGLGRLMFDIASAGFTCQGNEFSFYMLFASNYLLNQCTEEGCVTIYPWIHQSSNVMSNSDQMRPVNIPDVNPQTLSSTSHGTFSMSAGDFLDVYTEPCAWDSVVMCFFLDTAHNVITYIEKVYEILKPGGYWINFGPLLYHFAETPCEPSIELTYEELRSLITEHFNFKIIHEKTEQKASYVQNSASMLRMEYDCVFFVAQKIVE